MFVYFIIDYNNYGFMETFFIKIFSDLRGNIFIKINTYGAGPTAIIFLYFHARLSDH